MQIIKRQIICVVGQKYLAYHKGALYVSDDMESFKKLCNIPLTTKQQLFASFSLSARLFRLYPRAVCVIDENCFIFAFQGCIYHVNISKKTIEIEHRFPLPMKTPLAFTKVEGVKGFDDCILYGEYHANPQKRDMGVYARNNGKWEKVYSFSADQILHIHGFSLDKANDRILILTGDTDKESAIYEVKNNFTEIRPLLCGSQKYRSCVAFADQDSLIYATDTPLESNAIYQYYNGSVSKLYDMPGPTIFGAEIGYKSEKQFVFATSVEPDSRIRGKRYWVTRKLGLGVKERYCHIVAGNESRGFRTILKLKKDWLPMTAFQFGNASFCVGNGLLFVLPQSICGMNEKTIVLQVESVFESENV